MLRPYRSAGKYCTKDERFFLKAVKFCEVCPHVMLYNTGFLKFLKYAAGWHDSEDFSPLWCWPLYGFFFIASIMCCTLGRAQIAANWLSIAIFTPLDDNISLLELFSMSKHCRFEWAGTWCRLTLVCRHQSCFKAYLSLGDPKTWSSHASAGDTKVLQ